MFRRSLFAMSLSVVSLSARTPLRFATLLLVVAAFGGRASNLQAREGKPNVVVILTDDQGWGDLSLNGNRNLSTPNIDMLAAGGARFDRFYVCPVCSPTRAEFLTGRYHARGGVYSTSAGGERLDLDESTIGDAFKAAGYATAAFGKWHNGMQYPYHPNARGFDEYYGFCSGHWGDYFSPPLEHNGKPVRGEGFVIDDFTNHAMKFMEKHREKPFFVYLPYNTPHSPMQAPERFWKKFRDADLAQRNREPKRENLQHTRAALAMCENIDWNVGRLLNKLDELQLADNTIVVYFCDNGPNGVRFNGGMKGRKGSTDEGGVRSPLLVRWPKRIQPGREVTPIASVIDLFPTLAALAGVEPNSRKPLDGEDVSSYLLGKRTPAGSDRTLISSWRGKVSARTQRFRLDNNGRLFDMHADPGQTKDVSEEHPDVAKRLRRKVAEYQRDVLSELPAVDERRFPLGHPDARYTQFPARDAAAGGEIKRSNRFPNCSFFTNWIRQEDQITWDVDALSNGKYRVDLYYTCPADDVGSVVRLKLNDSAVVAKITEPHDPPLRGAENDYVKRIESYVKDFRRMSMGEMQLKKGPGKLTLEALEMPGGQVMDFRMLLFTRVDD